MQLGTFVSKNAALWPGMSDNLMAALAVSLPIVLTLLYVRGVARAYIAAGENWKTMDPDVRVVFLLIVPLFRAGVALLMAADWLFYRPGRKDTCTSRRDHEA